MSAPERRRGQLVEQIAASAQHLGVTVGVAESLTGGQISVALAAGPDAAQWFRGSIVAYAPVVKLHLLDVSPGPVNTSECASQMALGASAALDCDLAVSATGVGGPGPDEGVAPGTVFIACSRRGHEVALGEHKLGGPPPAVVNQTVELALESILKALLESQGPPACSDG